MVKNMKKWIGEKCETENGKKCGKMEFGKI